MVETKVPTTRFKFWFTFSILNSVVSTLSDGSLDGKRRCFSQYSDFQPGNLAGKWHGLSDSEWKIEQEAGRRERVNEIELTDIKLRFGLTDIKLSFGFIFCVCFVWR